MKYLLPVSVVICAVASAACSPSSSVSSTSSGAGTGEETDSSTSTSASGGGGAGGASGSGGKEPPVAPCPASAPCVLFYGPNSPAGVLETPYLPTGSVVTVADEPTWRSMKQADFEKYNLLILGDNSDWEPHPEMLQAAADTSAEWNPAITGRVVIQGLDAAFHASIDGHNMNPATMAGAKAYAVATMAWLTSGPGTALYVSQDKRNADFLQGLGAISTATSEGDEVEITDAAHPIMQGSTGPTLSHWDHSYHRIITAHPDDFQVAATVTGHPDQPLVIVRGVDP